MEPTQPSLMDKGLNELKAAKRPASIHLKNGIKLTGQIMDFDEGSIRLAARDPFGVIIDRSAVSSLQPNLPHERT